MKGKLKPIISDQEKKRKEKPYIEELYRRNSRMTDSFGGGDQVGKWG